MRVFTVLAITQETLGHCQLMEANDIPLLRTGWLNLRTAGHLPSKWISDYYSLLLIAIVALFAG